MPQSEMKNAPPLYGWAIGAAAGAVFFGVSLLVLGIGGNGSVAIGAVVALVVGLVFTIAEGKPKADTPATPASAHAAPAPAAAPTASATPEAAPADPARDDPGQKPAGLQAPDGTPDDLKRISGVGPVIEGKLHDLGIYHFRQIAAWSRDEIAWVDGYLNFRGRIDRDDWLGQASKLAESG